MIARVVVTALLVGGIALSGLAFAPSAATAAPSATDLGQLQFSESITELAEPVNPRIEFASNTERIWTSFTHSNFAGGRLSVIIRLNGEDYYSGNLDCCRDPNGRFAFSLERQGGDLPGGAYTVFIYENDREIGRGGFGVQGSGGSDDNDNDDGGNDNGDRDNDND